MTEVYSIQITFDLLPPPTFYTINATKEPFQVLKDNQVDPGYG